MKLINFVLLALIVIFDKAILSSFQYEEEEFQKTVYERMREKYVPPSKKNNNLRLRDDYDSASRDYYNNLNEKSQDDENEEYEQEEQNQNILTDENPEEIEIIERVERIPVHHYDIEEEEERVEVIPIKKRVKKVQTETHVMNPSPMKIKTVQRRPHHHNHHHHHHHEHDNHQEEYIEHPVEEIEEVEEETTEEIKPLLHELLIRLKKFEGMNGGGKGRLTNCSLNGRIWFSTLAGAAIQFEASGNNDLSIKVLDLPNKPAIGIVNKSWKGKGIISIQIPTTITLILQEPTNNNDYEDPRTAVFVGQCLLCQEPVIQGTWILFPTAQKCFAKEKTLLPKSDTMYLLK